MKTRIIVLAILVGAGTYVHGQGYVDIVYGNVGYASQSGVQVVFTFGYPVIDVLKSDEDGTVTVGIPAVFISDRTVSTKTPLPLKGISVYPNPVDNVLYVNREEAGQDYLLQLYNVQGMELLRKRWIRGDNDLQVKMSEVIPGQYFLRLTQEDNRASAIFKLLKVH